MNSRNQHIVNQINNSKLLTDNTLHVVAMISNPIRYHSRYRLFRQWYQQMLHTPNVIPYVVQVAFGDRAFQVTQSYNPNHLQLRTRQQIWHKQNALNLGIKHLLPLNWKYVCWCDADISFRNPEWAQQTMHQLQHHPIVQPWQHVTDLGFDGQVLSTFDSFCSLVRRNIRMQVNPTEPYKYGHSGFAWACTRKFWQRIVGLIDFAILGSADHHMAWGCIGQIQNSIHQGMSKEFKSRCIDWQRKAFMLTGGNVGFVKGRIEHNFHGSKKNRFYRQRWEIFVNNKFNPDTQLMYDQQGLVTLIGNPKLQQDIRSYMRARNQDSIDS